MFKRVMGMAKVWKDVDEVVKMIHDLEDEKLRELDREMKTKPKFDHIADVGKMVKKEINKRKEYWSKTRIFYYINYNHYQSI